MNTVNVSVDHPKPDVCSIFFLHIFSETFQAVYFFLSILQVIGMKQNKPFVKCRRCHGNGANDRFEGIEKIQKL